MHLLLISFPHFSSEFLSLSFSKISLYILAVNLLLIICIKMFSQALFLVGFFFFHFQMHHFIFLGRQPYITHLKHVCDSHMVSSISPRASTGLWWPTARAVLRSQMLKLSPQPHVPLMCLGYWTQTHWIICQHSPFLFLTVVSCAFFSMNTLTPSWITSSSESPFVFVNSKV